ncbi:hypothetical protein [Tardiphaga sp.]|jgi:hypothetical protein|uniref:hypothetical protein n=1 Tax=Tardiphaga sp. TaxID=1926292 RepID=UPI0037DA4688
MLDLSFGFAAVSMVVAAIYLVFRCRFRITSVSMLLAAMLVIHGPGYLYYVLFSHKPPIFLRMEKSEFFESGLIALNISLASMFFLIIAGSEMVNAIARHRASAADDAVARWPPSASIGFNNRSMRIGLCCVAIVMFGVSFYEGHIRTIVEFMTSDAKTTFRLQRGGSEYYLYRVALSSVAPMLAAWGLTHWLATKDRGVAIASLMLLAAVLIGKIETLQKANAPLFAAQLILAAQLMTSNRVTIKFAAAVTALAACCLAPTVALAVTGYEEKGVLSFLSYRIFLVPNEVLLEHFIAFPGHLPHTMGGNIRPLASLMGMPYIPSYDVVSFHWRQVSGSTSTTMFIGDAWDAFSYTGVAAASLLAGAICRSIDLVFLAKGKTPIGAAMLSASFIGIYNLLISGIETSSFSGGLLLCPAIALVITYFGRKQRNRPSIAQI